jgi:hypothetical protein
MICGARSSICRSSASCSPDLFLGRLALGDVGHHPVPFDDVSIFVSQATTNVAFMSVAGPQPTRAMDPCACSIVQYFTIGDIPAVSEYFRVLAGLYR